MSKILFVCTGNVFRSMSAEFIMHARAKQMGIEEYCFSSAGTLGRADKKLRTDVIEELEHRDIDPRAHKPRRLTQGLIDDTDLIVAMGTDHKDFIKERFNSHAALFMEVAQDKPEGLPDLPEVIPDFKNQPEASRLYIRETVDLILQESENFLRQLPRFLPGK